MRIAGVACLVLAAFTHGSAAMAQERVQGVRVEYIAGRNVYLSGAAGIAAGDTLGARRTPDGARTGLLRVIATATEHVVVTFAGAPFPVTLGDSLWITGGRLPAAAAAAADTRAATGPDAAPRPARRSARTPLPAHARVAGRLSLDFDALSSHTADPVQDRALYTPAVRVRARATGLPAGLRADVNARYAHPHTTGLFAPEPSLRIYRAVLETAYDAPVRLRAGRFANEHDPFSGYWDGILVRAGTRTFGVGATAGFEPDLGNQGFSSTVRKYGAFADAAVRSTRFGWTLDVAAVVRDGSDDRPDRTFGAAQSLRAGPLRSRQRVQLAQAGGGAWELAQAEIDAGLTVAGPLSLRGFLSERRFGAGIDTSGVARARRRNAGGGVVLAGRAATFFADVARTTWDVGSPATSWSAMLFVPRSPIAGIGFGANVTSAVQAEQRTLLVAPRLSRAFGRSRLSGSYQYYGTHARTGSDAHTSAFDLSFTFPLGAHLEADLRARTQRGAGLATDRLYAMLSMNF